MLFKCNILKINLVLSLLLSLCFFILSGHIAAIADDAPEKDGHPVVFIELFTAEDCAFCPAADRLLGDMIKMPGVIGLGCHVDYFETEQDTGLALSFCRDRQQDYAERLASGPPYTPQMVINGHLEAVGYKTEAIARALKEAQNDAPEQITIRRLSEDGAYGFSLPARTGMEDRQAALWLAVFDIPQERSSKNGEEDVSYYNAVSHVNDLGMWDGSALVRTITPHITEENAGFVIAAQDIETGRILAAGIIYMQ